MTDPAASSAGSAVGALLGASTASIIGVDLITIGWSLVGGWLGTSFAPKLGPVKSAVQFLVAALTSALFATLIASYLRRAYGVSDPNVERGLALGISAAFYILKKVVLARIGGVMDRFITRVFGPDDKGNPQ